MNEIILNKKVGVERCINQIRLYYAMASNTPFELDYLKQDAIAMNLQRIAELTIDVANHLIKSKKLGLPQDSADAFVLLHRANLISVDMMKTMKRMVGFRNVVVHEYQEMDLRIMVNVIEDHLHEPLTFVDYGLESDELTCRRGSTLVIRFAPPLTIKRAEAENALAIFEEALTEVER